jgi:hypothetical protein
MKRNLIVASFAVGVVMASLLLLQGSAWAQGESPLTVSDGEHKAHIFPTVSRAAQLGIPAADTGPLLYHAGGPVMTGAILLYNIYWVPAHLQNGNPTSMSTHYKNVQTNLLHDYPEHGIGNNNTQYYQTIGGVTTYIYNRPNGYVTYLDTNPYPASGCTDPATPGNCITDAQIQTEIQRVMTLNHWTGGLNKMFLLFTSSGEGSCFDAGGSSCAYTQYCAYHGAFGSAPVVYSNEPYGDPSVCSAGGPFPTGDAAADTAVGTATHELTEALTDPELNAWYSALGNEIGDLCAYDYGTNTWDSGQANQMWYGHFYEIQQEYDNHVGGCVQVGP